MRLSASHRHLEVSRTQQHTFLLGTGRPFGKSSWSRLRDSWARARSENRRVAWPRRNAHSDSVKKDLQHHHTYCVDDVTHGVFDQTMDSCSMCWPCFFFGLTRVSYEFQSKESAERSHVR